MSLSSVAEKKYYPHYESVFNSKYSYVDLHVYYVDDDEDYYIAEINDYYTFRGN
jgi:hypothetical protein